MRKVRIRYHYPSEFLLPWVNHPYESRRFTKKFTKRIKEHWDLYLDSFRALTEFLLQQHGYQQGYFSEGGSYFLFPEEESIHNIAKTIYLIQYPLNMRADLVMLLFEEEQHPYHLLDLYKNPLEEVLCA
jgi:hypothetical protein